MSIDPLLAVIPARGGSKGLARKNLLELAGIPLIAHSVLFARMCPAIDRCVVSTDSDEIADVARHYGAEVPFMRPTELARDDTPTLPVMQHAILEMERIGGQRFNSLLLLQPTSPVREPEHVTDAIALIESDVKAQGAVGVAEPAFNPRYVCVEEKGGYMQLAFGQSYDRRQDVPKVYRITGSLYLWRRDFLLSTTAPFGPDSNLKMVFEREPTIDIDTAADLQFAELLIREGVVRLPWLASHCSGDTSDIGRAVLRSSMSNRVVQPARSWDPAWDSVFRSHEWGKYPTEPVIRFVAHHWYRVPDRKLVRLLDLGCGPGASTWYMAREGFSVSAIDASPAALQQLQRRLKEERLEVEVREGDLVSLPWPDACFDGAVDNVSICHNNFANSQRILAEVMRVLKPGGRLFSSSFTNRTWGCGTGREVGPGEYVGLTEGPAKDKGLVRFMDLAQLRQLYAGFSDLEVEKASWTAQGMQHVVEQWLVTCRRPA